MSNDNVVKHGNQNEDLRWAYPQQLRTGKGQGCGHLIPSLMRERCSPILTTVRSPSTSGSTIATSSQGRLTESSLRNRFLSHKLYHGLVESHVVVVVVVIHRRGPERFKRWKEGAEHSPPRTGPRHFGDLQCRMSQSFRARRYLPQHVLDYLCAHVFESGEMINGGRSEQRIS